VTMTKKQKRGDYVLVLVSAFAAAYKREHVQKVTRRGNGEVAMDNKTDEWPSRGRESTGLSNGS
jgi:hypothetical protein